MSDPFGLDAPDDRWLGTLRAAIYDATPERVGRYRLQREIGRGGQGIVFLAEDVDVGREIAVKHLGRGLFATEADVARFEREIDVLSGLRHPGIVTVFGIERTADGPWICMELIGGERIDRWAETTRAGTNGQRRILEVFVLVCDAVRHAHANGVLHRDLKPSNILVDDDDRPHVLDFGVAKLLTEDDVELTSTDEFVGTPLYTAPEQFELPRGAPDVRWDVYSLGVVLFELLTGSAPHEPNGPLSEVIARIRNVDAPRASRVGSGVALELDAIVATALARNPEARYRGVDALADDVRRHLDGRSVLAEFPSQWQRLRSLVRRNRTAFALSTTAAAIVLAFGIVNDTQTRRLSEQREAARGLRDEANATAGRLRTALERNRLMTYSGAIARIRDGAAAMLRLPATSESVPTLDRWLAEQAEPLRELLPEFERELRTLRATALSWSAELADQVAAVEGAPRVMRARESLEAARVRGDFGPEAYRLSHLIQSAQRTSAKLLGDLRFENDEMQFRWESTERAYRDLDALMMLVVLRVEGQLAWARDVERRSIQDHADRWREASVLVAEDARYDGVRLRPQIGLVPIGRDPDSGLLEFADLRSADDPEELPERDAAGRLTVTERTGVVFVLIPPRSSATAPNETEPFLLSKYEITQSQWERLTWVAPAFAIGPPMARSMAHPVDSVSWHDASQLLAEQGWTLPTRSEWEYACRAGTDGAWYSGDDWRSLQGFENTADRTTTEMASTDTADWSDGHRIHARVGSFRPNPFGLHDMLGNVGELCAFDPDEVEVAREQGGAATPACWRMGGSFFRHPRDCRVNARQLRSAAERSQEFGLRPARRWSH